MKLRYLCLRCGHEWYSQREPAKCPKCRSYNFDLPKGKQRKKA